ncbi:outer membrane beta-barrel protein [Paraflavisolibacter sp. H34]|uniref:outer membrane beta-barrel protein n=1 Tax=Huijunlia imazamoxiresistens TaxID=3127457 RepID=UPI0030160C4C
MRLFALTLCLFLSVYAAAQVEGAGLLSGSLQDEGKKPLAGATVQLFSLADSAVSRHTLTATDGSFSLSGIPFGYYRLQLSFAGFSPLTLDSIFFRAERFDFNLEGLTLPPQGSLGEVIVYAEKPLVESKDGNITFNAGQSALSATSSASDLLTTVPLVSKDADGKLVVRGREPKILIDDKPVELNAQQLQDLLESMPGSSIEKIEVLTNPPARYANEPGGVINIVTKKGKVGRSGRVTVYGGSRGELAANGSYLYRKNTLSFTLTAGATNSRYAGAGHSDRKNLYKDSVNHFFTESSYRNLTLRPNLRANLDYDINKYHSLNGVLQYNQNNYDNRSEVENRNQNRHDQVYKLVQRDNGSRGDGYSPNISLNYTFRSRKPGTVARLFTNANFSSTGSGRNFYEQLLHPVARSLVSDSILQQDNANRSTGYHLRGSLDQELPNKKTSLSLGGYLTGTHERVTATTAYKRKGASELVGIDSLDRDFRFQQHLANLRASVRQQLGAGFSLSAGTSAEATGIAFDFRQAVGDTANRYWSWLPFFNLAKNWKSGYSLTATYRRSIRRPGIYELNPTKDYFDPYNTRFGNPDLEASLAHNFDLMAGKTQNSFFANAGLGYNRVENIFSQIRTRVSDSRTEITWQNISSRQEYEASAWGGYTINRKVRLNGSASYTYNRYSDFDKVNRKYRDGGSLTSNLNGNYSLKDRYTFSGNVTLNRFANPQGTVRSTLSSNIGLQARVLKKKMTVGLNLIDLFSQQQNRSFTYGTNYELESFSTANSRNIRLSLSYNLTKAPAKKPQGKVINKQQLLKKF